jgi:peptidoglycan hydrolase-like protein with peptidoglycan-binding domain
MHVRKTLAILMVSASLALPVAAAALSIDDIQAQLRGLLSRITQLQASTAAVNPDSADGVISVTAVPRICMLDFAGSLRFGSRGEAVRGLQEFLKSEGVLNAEATGYFGALTQAALQKWQASQGVVASGSAQTTGWGVFGPATRARVNARCGTANVVTAYPTSGTAPLTVTVISQVGDAGTIRPSAYDAQDTLIDFGDGSERQWVNCTGKQDDRYGTLCDAPQKFAHTYTADGNYTITLLKAGGMCVGGCPERTLGTAYVTVGAAQQTGNFDAAPHSGSAPLAVDFTYHPSSDGTGTYWIDYGDGSGEQMTVHQIQCIRAPCISPSVASHTYAAAGTYTATVTGYIACMHSNPRCMIATLPLATTTITVSGTPTACTMEYMPVCGRPAGCANTCPAGMYCTMICRLHDPVTYGNRCEMNAAGAEFISEGACSAQSNTQ